MKTMLIAILFTGLSAMAQAQDTKTDFRAFNWGASFEQVQSNEKAQFLAKEKNDMLEYNDELGGYNCDVIYSFNENDKLVSGNYLFTKKYINPQFYWLDYNTFKNLLAQKYGKPIADKEHWSNNTPVSEKTNVAQAIADGNLWLSAEWITGRSTVQIYLSASNKQPMLRINYTAKSLTELQDKRALQKALPNL